MKTQQVLNKSRKCTNVIYCKPTVFMVYIKLAIKTKKFNTLTLQHIDGKNFQVYFEW